MQEAAETLTFPVWSVVPFVAMLLSIAVLPMTIPAWWDSNRNKAILSVGLSVPVLALVVVSNPVLLLHTLLEYFSFIVLLGSLFIISGGIYVKGEFAGTPLINTGFLAIGAVLANLIGTTGASMLLIRPYMRANHARQRKIAPCHFFYLHSQQHCWPFDTSWGSSAVSRFPARCAVPVDTFPVSAVGFRCWCASCRFQHL